MEVVKLKNKEFLQFGKKSFTLAKKKDLETDKRSENEGNTN